MTKSTSPKTHTTLIELLPLSFPTALIGPQLRSFEVPRPQSAHERNMYNFSYPSHLTPASTSLVVNLVTVSSVLEFSPITRLGECARVWRREGKTVGVSEGLIPLLLGLCATGVLRDRATLDAVI